MRDTSDSMSNAAREAGCFFGNFGGFADSCILINNWLHGSGSSSLIGSSGIGSSFIAAVSSGRHPFFTTPRINMMIAIDEAVLSYAEIKALCAGNPLIKEKMDLDIEVARLKLLKAEHQCQCYRLEDCVLKIWLAEIESAKEQIDRLTEDIERLKAGTVPNKDGFSPMNTCGTVYTEKAEAGRKLLDICKNMVGKELARIAGSICICTSIQFANRAK